MFSKILIANRGEIAVRIANVCRRLGVKTVSVHSDADLDALHTKATDETVHIGPSRPAESYLDTGKILAAARETGAQAIHPGYGFLSERADFARACADAGLVFIGASPESIERMGDKVAARETARHADIPVVPGTPGVILPEDAEAAAESIGYPVLVKASAGGGGIGMMVAEDSVALVRAVKSCSDRAQAAFGDGSLYLERYFHRPRHIEIQVLADGQGNVVHLFERECSIQRRHQKVIEEAPSPLFIDGQNSQLAQRMYAAAVRLAREVDYVGLGTVECLVVDGDFHFIEMNTRLQVEHPCTESTCGIDLIHWQLRVASGEALDFSQADVRRSGHCIEMRIYAENPEKNFFPSPGVIEGYRLPVGEGIRVDSGVEDGYKVTPFYDPMIAKLIVSGENRPQAIERSLAALDQFEVGGIKTNISAHRKLIATDAFAAGELSTRFIDEHF